MLPEGLGSVSLHAGTAAGMTQQKDQAMHAGNGLKRQHCWCVFVRPSKHECVVSKLLVLRLPVLQSCNRAEGQPLPSSSLRWLQQLAALLPCETGG